MPGSGGCRASAARQRATDATRRGGAAAEKKGYWFDWLLVVLWIEWSSLGGWMSMCFRRESRRSWRELGKVKLTWRYCRDTLCSRTVAALPLNTCWLCDHNIYIYIFFQTLICWKPWPFLLLLSLLNFIVGDTWVFVSWLPPTKRWFDRLCSALNQKEEQVETKPVSSPG